MRTLGVGLLYLAVCFGVGFMLGPIRELVLRPRLGELGALLIEAPAMLTVVTIAAWQLVRHSGLQPRAALFAGLTALLGLLLLDGLVGSFLRGLTVREQLDRFATLPGAVTLTLYAAFAVAPCLAALRAARAAASR